MSVQPARVDSRRTRRLAALLLTLGTVALSCAGLVHYQTGVADTAAYGAYLVLAVLLPGILVHKALRGAQETWLADLGLGATTGLCLELVAWAGFSLLHLQGLLWLWPVLTLPLLAFGRSRDRILERPSQTWHPALSTLTAFAVCVVLAHVARTYIRAYHLMPSSKPYYQDIVWHLGLAWESQRSFPLGTPQVVGDGTLRYHWFADAHVGIGALISHTSVPTVMMRLWILPVVALTVVITAALTQRLSGRAWAGALAALVVVPHSTFQFWSGNTWTLDQFSALSPSQVFAMPVTLLVLHALTDVVRSGSITREAVTEASAAAVTVHPVGSLVVAGIGAVACMGAKASATPTLLGGLVITLGAALLLRRGRRLLLVITGVAAVVTAAALAFVAGGDAGSGYQLFSNYSLLPFYRSLVTAHPNLTTSILPGLFGKPGPGPMLVVGLTLVTLLAFLRAVSFVLPLFRGRMRGDLAAWLVAGTCAAAFGPLFLVSHPGYSQYYFLYGVVPVGAALLSWGVADVIGDDPRLARVAGGAGVVAGLLATGLAWRAAYQPSPGSRRQWLATLDEFSAEVAVAVVVVAVAAVVGWRRRRSGRPTALVAVVMAAIVAPIVVSGPLQEAAALVKRPLAVPVAERAAARARQAAATRSGTSGGSGPAAAVNAQSPVVIRAETEAALWIQQNVPLRALTATNAQCLQGSTISCDGRRWWVSGLGGRRVLLSGWAYTPRGAHHDFYDPALYTFNEDTFSAPNAALVSRMRATGVTWLVAEHLPGLTVSPDLDRFATRRYANRFVTIYRLNA